MFGKQFYMIFSTGILLHVYGKIFFTFLAFYSRYNNVLPAYVLS